jgi:glycine cleavage system H protein
MTRLFTTDHEWIEVDGTGAVIGITEYARQQLGDIVFVELPALGRKLARGEAAGVVESVKAASDIYAPVSGEVLAVNDAVSADPALINAEPEAGGWLFKLKLSNDQELTSLLDSDAYSKLTV